MIVYPLPRAEWPAEFARFRCIAPAIRRAQRSTQRQALSPTASDRCWCARRRDQPSAFFDDLSRLRCSSAMEMSDVRLSQPKRS